MQEPDIPFYLARGDPELETICEREKQKEMNSILNVNTIQLFIEKSFQGDPSGKASDIDSRYLLGAV